MSSYSNIREIVAACERGDLHPFDAIDRLRDIITAEDSATETKKRKKSSPEVEPAA
jgi:hypothetical protein